MSDVACIVEGEGRSGAKAPVQQALRRLRAKGLVEAAYAGHERIEPSIVIWTAPVTLACDQLGIDTPNLPYLSTLCYNVMTDEPVPRDYQWCYYGADDIVFSRLSTPNFFAPDTVPHANASGICVEITCQKGDERWNHAERLTDWVIDDLIKVKMLRSRRKVHDVRIERVSETYPIYHGTYPTELEKARKALGRFVNLQLAGRTGMFWYNNMDHSIENAMQLTKKLLRDAGPPRLNPPYAPAFPPSKFA